MDQRANLQRVAIDARVILDSVPCNVCQHEVPASEALVTEATDYVVYFCGLDCYERWRNQRDGHCLGPIRVLARRGRLCDRRGAHFHDYLLSVSMLMP